MKHTENVILLIECTKMAVFQQPWVYRAFAAYECSTVV